MKLAIMIKLSFLFFIVRYHLGKGYQITRNWCLTTKWGHWKLTIKILRYIGAGQIGVEKATQRSNLEMSKAQVILGIQHRYL